MNNFIIGIEHQHQRTHTSNKPILWIYLQKQLKTIHFFHSNLCFFLSLDETVCYFVFENLLLFAYARNILLFLVWHVNIFFFSTDIALCHFVTNREDFFSLFIQWICGSPTFLYIELGRKRMTIKMCNFIPHTIL